MFIVDVVSRSVGCRARSSRGAIWVVVQSVKLGHGTVDELGRGAMVRQSRVLEQAWGNYSSVKSAHTHKRSQLLGLRAFYLFSTPLVNSISWRPLEVATFVSR
ncbi:unnamed protein product [Sphagnum troendelagicum]